MSMFFLANVLTAIFAKLLSSRFHKENHFKKMAQALTNVRIRTALRLNRLGGLLAYPCGAADARRCLESKQKAGLPTCARSESAKASAIAMPLVENIQRAPRSLALNRTNNCRCAGALPDSTQPAASGG